MQKILFIIILLINSHSIAQKTYQATIEDENGRAIPNVHIWIEGTTIGTISNNNGAFTIPVKTYPIHLHISHLSYVAKELIINLEDKSKHKILLKKLVHTLPTAVISNQKIKDLTQNYWYDISDFEIYQDHVLLLAYQWKRKKNPWLIMLDAYGDTLWSSYLGRDGELYKDCLGQIHLLNKKAAYQLFIEEDNFQLYPAVSIKEFKEQLKPCIASHNEKIYLEQYTYASQILNYFEADLSDTTVRMVETIADRQAMRWLQDDAMGLSPLRNEHEKRFEEMFFYDPIYAPLIKQGDTTIIFDFVNDEIELYNSDFTSILDVPIDFHKTLKWKEKLFVDEKNGKVYTMFRRNGFHYLYQINLWTGKLYPAMKIPQFTFLGKIRIHDGNIFFLYRDRKEEQALTKIYQMAVEY